MDRDHARDREKRRSLVEDPVPSICQASWRRDLKAWLRGMPRTSFRIASEANCRMTVEKRSLEQVFSPLTRNPMGIQCDWRLCLAPPQQTWADDSRWQGSAACVFGSSFSGHLTDESVRFRSTFSMFPLFGCVFGSGTAVAAGRATRTPESVASKQF
mmetsp:Transcript_7228/g.17856  ORF Transcript_7228/g.17856 Transcript_7228/m.17856 type:complete len:157 (+) Transcript_7228:946-1416(+)